MPKDIVEGRPWFDGKDPDLVLSLLYHAWDVGATDGEAAMHAGISRSSLSRFLIAFPELREERDARKEKMILLSRGVILRSLSAGDEKTAMWYLEKKKKDEFSSRTENINVNLEAEDKEAFERLLNTPINEEDVITDPTLEDSQETLAEDKAA